MERRVGDRPANAYVLRRLHELGRNVAQQPADDRDELLQQRRRVVRLHILDLIAQRDRCGELAVESYGVLAAAREVWPVSIRNETDRASTHHGSLLRKKTAATIVRIEPLLFSSPSSSSLSLASERHVSARSNPTVPSLPNPIAERKKKKEKKTRTKGSTQRA